MPHTHRTSPAAGYILLEVPVSIVLISIGILGMVAMQVKAVTFNQDLTERNQAAMLAGDLMEIIRGDLDAVQSKGTLTSTSSFYKAAGDSFPDAPSACSPLPASASEALGCWAQRAARQLPGASALETAEFHVCRSAGDGCSSGNSAGSAIEIQLAWRVKAGECLNASASGDDTICRYVLREEP